MQAWFLNLAMKISFFIVRDCWQSSFGFGIASLISPATVGNKMQETGNNLFLIREGVKVEKKKSTIIIVLFLRGEGGQRSLSYFLF